MNPTDPDFEPLNGPLCEFCPHEAHGTNRCGECRCKGKARWWQRMLGGLGNAIGEAKFGG